MDPEDARRSRAIAMLDASFGGGSAVQEPKRKSGSKGVGGFGGAHAGDKGGDHQAGAKRRASEALGMQAKRGSGEGPGREGGGTPKKQARGIYEALEGELQVPLSLGKAPSFRGLVQGLVGDLPLETYASKFDGKVLNVGEDDVRWASKPGTAGRKGGGLKGKRRMGRCVAGGQGAVKEADGRREDRGCEGEYGGLLGLNDLWKQHIERLVASKFGDKIKRSALVTVLKVSDLRGAMAKVVGARCPTYVGAEGMVSRETAQTLVLVRKDGGRRCVAKEGTRLAVAWGVSLCVIDCGVLVGRTW